MSTTLVSNAGHASDVGLRFRPDATALLQHDLGLTYRELDERANRVANALAGEGVGHGDRVFAIWENDVRFVELVLGAMRLGAVLVPASTKLSPERAAAVLRDSGARVVVAGRQFRDVAAAALAGGDCDTAIALGDPGDGLASYDAWLAAAATTRPDVEVAPRDLCLQPYTSGSTGMPKGVLLTHRGWLHNCDLMRRVALLAPDDRVLCSNPLFHTNALACGVFPTMLAGGSAAILPAFDPVEVLAAIERWRATFTTGVPAMYKLLLAQREELARRDVSSIRFFLCGSAPMPKTLLDELHEAFSGAVVLEGYGLTEGGPLISILPRFGARRVGSIGQVLPEVEVRIVGPEGDDVARGEPGELWTRNPGVALGYHELPDVTQARFLPGGWLRTGDLVRQDEDGYLYFVGRADDRINVAGEHAYPAEAESILIQHPAVRDVAVVGMPHAVKGEVPVAFVVPEGDAPSLEELREFFCRRGPRFAQPREVFVLDALPLAATGKVDRAALAERAEAHAGRAAAMA